MVKKNNVLIEVGANLRSLREEMNISKQSLSEQIGLKESQIDSIEKGEAQGRLVMSYIFWLGKMESIDMNKIFYQL